MTLSVTAPTQSPLGNQCGPFPPPPLTTRSPPSEGGYSDPAVPSCVTSAEKHSQFSSHASSMLVSPPALESGQRSTVDKHQTLPSRKKARHDLRLPSFQVLNIVTPKIHPTALLTPPDEPLLSQAHPPDSNINFLPGSQPLPFTDMPDTSGGSGTTPRSAPVSEATSAPQQFISVTTPRGHISPAGDQSKTPTEQPKKKKEGRPTSVFSEPLDLVTSVALSNPSRTVFNVLSHSQPCPLASEGAPTTAFNELLINLQTSIPFGSYIEMTHALPMRFSMGQVPHSPVVTPNPLQPKEPTDYFSIQNTFSKAVVATSYQDALESSVPSSPHPIVAPSTVHVSLLERYIPPSSSFEFKDLFSTDAPSALVNRLIELSSDRGSLLFIYPTKTGAHTFSHNYLGPLLHPLLRRLTGVHGLATDLGCNIAMLGSVDSLLPFEDMKRKLELLLRKLGRSGSSTSTSPAISFRPPPRFEVIHASAQSVHLDRTSWHNWYRHQEISRIQEIVGRYFRRGYRLPSQEGVTAGSICREIMQGLEQQEYAHDCPPREGVEVGVFVVLRVG